MRLPLSANYTLLVTALKETVDSGGGKSYVRIAANMCCNKLTVCSKIEQDIAYYSYQKWYYVLINGASKESSKV